MDISIILAAGEGSRMQSNKPKVIHEICGKAILKYVIDASKDAGINKNYCVIGHGADEVKAAVGEDECVDYRIQPVGEEHPYGTGYAVMQAEDVIEDDNTVLILYGDTPLITSKTLKDFLNFHKENNNYGTVLTAYIEDATGYGRIVRDEKDELLKIVEHKDATEEELKIKEVNSGMYVFNGKYLKDALGKIDNNNAQGEYYITDVIQILKDQDKKVGAYLMEDPIEIYGVNSKVQLSFNEKIMKKRINERVMLEGAILKDPENTYIEENVKIGRDTIIYPGVSLKGNTVIGENTIIEEHSKIVDGKIGNNVSICSSVIIDSRVDDNCKIGPNAYLRPGSCLGENVKIGNFVEVKNSTIGDNTKASHLAYIGDASIGKNVNIGCGTVFANYDGKKKYKTIVGDNVFIGSNSTLIAPVEIEDRGFVAAGSTITDKVEKESLAIARARQVNKKDWVSKNN